MVDPSLASELGFFTYYLTYQPFEFYSCLTIFIVVAGMSLGLLVNSFHWVGYGYRRVVSRLGKDVRILNPGPRLIIPFIDQVATHKWGKYHTWDIPVNDFRIDPKPVEFTTKNAQTVSIDLNIYVCITDCIKAMTSPDLWDGLKTAIFTSVYATCARSEDDTQIRDRLEQDAREAHFVRTYLETYGVELRRIEIQRIVVDADTAKQRAESAKIRARDTAAIEEMKNRTKLKEEEHAQALKSEALNHARLTAIEDNKLKLRIAEIDNTAAAQRANLKNLLEIQAKEKELAEMSTQVKIEMARAEIEIKAMKDKAEAEAVGLMEEMKTKSLFEHIQDMPSTAKALSVASYFLSQGLRDNKSIQRLTIGQPAHMFSMLGGNASALPLGGPSFVQAPREGEVLPSSSHLSDPELLLARSQTRLRSIPDNPDARE